MAGTAKSKTTSKASIYVVAPRANSELALRLDALRLLCDPACRLPAHVTVRVDAEAMDSTSLKIRSLLVRRDRIRLAGWGEWSTSKGTCVYLKVDAPHLKAVWHKPDFPKFSPHLSLYDGSDASVLGTLRAGLKRSARYLEAAFTPGGLRRLVKFDTPDDFRTATQERILRRHESGFTPVSSWGRVYGNLDTGYVTEWNVAFLSDFQQRGYHP